MLDIVIGDVLNIERDALVVPIDGTMRPTDGNLERILGNVGRQFHRRYPNAEFLEALEAQLDLPLAIGIGKAASVELEEAPFKFVVLVSTLHHVQLLDNSGK